MVITVSPPSLVTANRQDFVGYPDLAVEDWTRAGRP
jgi:hypothetical protein